MRLLLTLLVCGLGLLPVAAAEAQTGGTVTGTVTDTRTGTALPGAQVRLGDTELCLLYTSDAADDRPRV